MKTRHFKQELPGASQAVSLLSAAGQQSAQRRGPRTDITLLYDKTQPNRLILRRFAGLLLIIIWFIGAFFRRWLRSGRQSILQPKRPHVIRITSSVR